MTQDNQPGLENSQDVGETTSKNIKCWKCGIEKPPEEIDRYNPTNNFAICKSCHQMMSRGGGGFQDPTPGQKNPNIR